MRDADMVAEPPATPVTRRAEPESGPTGTGAVSAIASAPAPTMSDGSLRQAHLMFLQRAAGNAAVSKMLTAGPQLRMQRQSATAQRSDAPGAGPEIRQGSIGDVVLPLPRVNIVDGSSKKKDWTKGIGGGALLTIPIPKLPGATVGIVGLGEIGATFTARYGPGRLENLRVGMTKWQAAQLAAGVSPLFQTNALRVLYQGPFTALADFYLPASIALRMFARAGMGLRGKWAGIQLVQIAASLEAELNAELGQEKPLQEPISIYYANGDLRFRAEMNRTLQFNLGLSLNAALTAEILKIWKWERRWRLAESVARNLDMTKWPTLVRVSVKNESHGTLPVRPDGPALNALIIPSETQVAIDMDEGELDVDAMLNRVFSESDKQGSDNEVNQKSGGPGGTPPGRGGHRAPTGTRDDPIPMTWWKPLWWYLDPVTLNINGEKRDFRRNSKAMLPSGEAIGVSYWPTVGDIIQITSPTKRTGTMQEAFNATLVRHGFRTAGWNADHVEDLEMGGFDDFDNLWPLEAGVNQRAGNWQLGQSVTFSKDTEPVGNIYGPIAIQGQEYLRGRYFRIRDVRNPP